MAITYLTSLDLSLNELQNVKAQLLASDPGSPVEGQIWYNTTSHTLKYRTNSTTITIGAGGVSALTVDNASIEDIGTGSNPSIRVKALGITNAMLAGSIANTKLATDPLARANHTGTQLAATISDFDTQVRTSTLNQMTAPTADLSINTHKLTNVTDPTAAQDAATKNYVDTVAQGLAPKDAVRAATTAAGTLATSFENADVIDGVTLATGDRILIKNQAAPAENGIYTVNASGAPTRATDADSSADLIGAAVFVSEGTTNGNTMWVMTTDGPITVNTTGLVWAQFAGAGTYTAGTGLTLTGTQFTIDTAWPGQTAIVTLGTVTTGTWSATTIALNKGGTGATTAAGARTNLGATGKYSALIGDGASTTITITQATHGLAADSTNLVQITNASTGAVVYADVTVVPANGNVTMVFATAPASNAYRVTIIG